LSIIVSFVTVSYLSYSLETKQKTATTRTDAFDRNIFVVLLRLCF